MSDLFLLLLLFPHTLLAEAGGRVEGSQLGTVQVAGELQPHPRLPVCENGVVLIYGRWGRVEAAKGLLNATAEDFNRSTPSLSGL